MSNPINTPSEGFHFAFKMTAEIEALSSRLDMDALSDNSRETGGIVIRSTEAVRYLEKFSTEIEVLCELAALTAEGTQVIGKKIAAVPAMKNHHRSAIIALADRIRTLAETSDQRAGNIRDVGSGIQKRIQDVIHDLNKADKTLFLGLDKIKVIKSTLRNILFGMVYIVNDLKTIGTNAREGLRDAEACLSALKHSSESLWRE